MIGFNYLGKLGQLGNQMFQYAAAYSMSKFNNMQAIVPPGLDLLDIFDIPPLDLSVYQPPMNYCSSLPVYNAKWVCSYDENVIVDTKNKTFYIDVRLIIFSKNGKYDKQIKGGKKGGITDGLHEKNAYRGRWAERSQRQISQVRNMFMLLILNIQT